MHDFSLKNVKKWKFSLKNEHFSIKIAKIAKNSYFCLKWTIFRKRFFEKVNLHYPFRTPSGPPPSPRIGHPPGHTWTRGGGRGGKFPPNFGEKGPGGPGPERGRKRGGKNGGKKEKKEGKKERKKRKEKFIPKRRFDRGSGSRNSLWQGVWL